MCNLFNKIYAGFVYLHGLFAFILFDTGASHSFLSQEFLNKSNLPTTSSHVAYDITTPTSEKITTRAFVPYGSIEIQGHQFPIDLIVMPIQGYDMILGMSWLTRYQAEMNYQQKRKYFTSTKSISKVKRKIDPSHPWL